MITFTREAWELASGDQIDAIDHIYTAETARLEILKGGFDLPSGYLMFIRYYDDGSTIVGGISDEGDVST